MARKMTGLGRGLDALFADAAPVNEDDYLEELDEDELAGFEELEAEAEKASKKDKNKNNRTSVRSKSTRSSSKDDDIDRVIYVDINDIKPNHDQPRKHFDEERLKELAESISENGVIQPLVVRKQSTGYELVAGERRWRASRIAGIKKVPCLVRDFDEKQNMIVAIIENMQREDLDPIEEALGINEMIKRFEFTQEQVARSLGKSRVYVTNSLRLLKLPEWIQQHISEGRITAAHGRTIINIDDAAAQKEVCEKVIKGGLSVRATEKLADAAKNKTGVKKPRKNRNKSTEIITVESELREVLGTKVNITGSEKQGRIELEYYSLEELNRLIEMLKKL